MIIFLRFIHSKSLIFVSFHFLALAAILFSAPRPARALDVNEEFVQKIDSGFSSSLINRKGQPRAVFAECPAALKNNEIIIYVRYSSGRFVLTSKLPRAVEKYVHPSVLSCKPSIFRTFKKGGAEFYLKGRSFGLKFAEGSHGVKCNIVYVPYSAGGAENDAFISDRGHLEISVESLFAGREPRLSPELLNDLLGRVFTGGSVRLKRSVKLNRYYYDRPDYFGYVNPAMADASELEARGAAWLYPSHKITYNRATADKNEKRRLDAKLATAFLRGDYPLISQDIRAKNSFVEDHIALDMSKLPQTDIGSGQNTCVYLSYGPGINYYDSRYLSGGDNFPSPRFVFDRGEIWREAVQFYPKNSWESFGTGISRYNEINFFQEYLSAEDPAKRGVQPDRPERAEPAFMTADKRAAYISELNDKIISYGLLNDTAELIIDFEFMSQKHRGNPVNNELRTAGAVYPAYSAVALIVPPGTKVEYIKNYEQLMKEFGLPEYLNATRYSDLFIEAPESGDRGMRAAYLKFIISRTDAGMNRLANSFAAGSERTAGKSRHGARHGYMLFLKACENIIKKDARGFFRSQAAKEAAAVHGAVREAFRDYLRALRTAEPEHIQKKEFLKFLKLYEKARAFTGESSTIKKQAFSNKTKF